jgi:hypothetical protein
VGATQSKGRFVRIRRRRRCGLYPPSPRLSEGVLVPLVWVHLYVYLDNARYIVDSLFSTEIVKK